MQLFGSKYYGRLWGREGRVAKQAGEVSDTAVCSTPRPGLGSRVSRRVLTSTHDGSVPGVVLRCAALILRFLRQDLKASGLIGEHPRIHGSVHTVLDYGRS